MPRRLFFAGNTIPYHWGQYRWDVPNARLWAQVRIQHGGRHKRHGRRRDRLLHRQEHRQRPGWRILPTLRVGRGEAKVALGHVSRGSPRRLDGSARIRDDGWMSNCPYHLGRLRTPPGECEDEVGFVAGMAALRVLPGSGGFVVGEPSVAGEPGHNVRAGLRVRRPDRHGDP